MGLADTAKTLQQNISPEIAWLRKLRAFTEENTKENLLVEFDKVDAYNQTAEGKANPKDVWIMTTDLQEKATLADFYGRVLKYAEGKQRKEKGGAEKAIKAHWDELQKMERGIKKRFEKQRQEWP